MAENADARDDLARDLEDFLDADASIDDLDALRAEVDHAGPETFDEGRVAAMLRKRQALDTEIERVLLHVSEQVAQVGRWGDRRIAPLAAQRDFLDGILERWTRSVAPKKRVRSISFPAGTLRLRAPGKYAVTIEDESAAIDECVARFPDAIETTVSVKKAALAQHIKPGPVDETIDGRTYYRAVTADGEVVAGIRLARASQDTFTIAGPKTEEGADDE